MITKIIQPKTVTDLDLAFATDVSRLLPEHDSIPDEFKSGHNPYVKLVRRWFYEGLTKSIFIAKPGIDSEQAFRHLQACMRSFQPKHEHKEAGVAYLLNMWFDIVDG